MTKQSKSGEGNTHHENRDLENHLGDTFKAEDQDNNEWQGQQLSTKSDPLVDKGTGKPVILRVFEFSANPIVLKREKPTKQQLFDAHALQIKHFLWKDGLEPLDIISPKIVVSKKREKYRIFVTCQPKPGVTLVETPQTLQELTHTHGNRLTPTTG